MKEQQSELISLNELLETYGKENLVLVDARSGQKANYLKEHLKGALFVDLNEDLSDIKKDFADGGRHPLPSLGYLITNCKGNHSYQKSVY